MQTSSQTNLPSLNAPKKARGGLYLAAIAIIIALTSCLSQLFLWQEQDKARKEIAIQTQQVQDTLQMKLQAITAELNQQHHVLAKLIAHNQFDEKRSARMRAIEAKHLLVLAQYNLLFENNIAFASKLLADADQKLQETSDPGIDSVRKALANILSALNAIPPADITALMSQLSALSERVSSLSSLASIPAAPPLTVTAVAHTSWKEKLMATLHRLNGILAIRRLPSDIKPMASAEQESYIRESIRLKLSEAEWAVLHPNPSLYKQSLEQAKIQIAKYYAQNPVGSYLLKKIEELLTINIKPPVPDLSPVITLLNDYIRNTCEALDPTNSPNFMPTTLHPIPKANNTSPKLTTTPMPRVLPS